MKCFVSKLNFGLTVSKYMCIPHTINLNYITNQTTCLLNKYGFLYWYDRTYYLEFNILDIYKVSLEYFEIHLYIKVIYILFILFINEDK